MEITDTLTIDAVNRTREGYLTADVRAARVGIQEYLGKEVGKPDMAIVRVYRPESEVFNKDTIASFATIAVTNDHPPVAVTADNWRKYGVGETGDEVLRDGEYMRIGLMVRDAGAVQAFEDGKRQLSCGYTCDLDWTAGTTEDGLPYDAVQRNIRGNHLAIVGRARGGPELKIGDSQVTNLKTITVDGIPVEVTDAGATVIATLQSRIAQLIADSKTTETTHATALATRDADLAKRDAQIATLTASQMTDAQRDEAVAARADLIEKAKRITGDAAFKTAGLSDADIKKAVVVAKRPTVAVTQSAAYFDAAFDLLVEDVAKIDPVAQALGNRPVSTYSGPTLVADKKAEVEAKAKSEDFNSWRNEA